MENAFANPTGFQARETDNVNPVSGFFTSSPPKMHLSSDSGASWTAAAATTNGEFVLTGTLVPEPGRMALLLGGSLGIMLRRRRMV